MLDNSHIRFATEIEWGNSYHYTNLHSYWMDWLVLRDVLNTACNIMSATYKGVGRVGGLTMSVDTANKVVCTISQTDSHSCPDHTTSRADIKWNSLGSYYAPQWLHRVCVGPVWLDRVGKKLA